MTPKERAAMQQALEALLSCEEDYIYDGENEYECDSIDWDKRNKAIVALREALAKPCVNGCDTSNGRCVDCPDSVSEQAEQEPVAWMDLHKELGQLRWAGKDIGWDLAIDAVRNRLEELYAAPVRTKDLTDAEIATLLQRHTIDGNIMPFALCEAAIAADREKNK